MSLRNAAEKTQAENDKQYGRFRSELGQSTRYRRMRTDATYVYRRGSRRLTR